MPLRHLFLDMNAFFASCEQQADEKLRGKPVAVIPTDAETTACIAASYEAKAFGVKTGTPVWEARKLCPGIVCVTADHKRYVVMHNRVLDAIGSVIPIDRIMSIDEMSCRLEGDDRKPENAEAIAHSIKQAVYTRAGSEMRCSIGIGPNVMLAKMAADMRKPNGLTLLTDADLPGALHGLKLQDFPGIGPRMARRLNLYGVFAVKQLCEMPLKSLAEVWGSQVLGGRWYRLLRGEDVEDPIGRRQSVSHSHVLPPEFRTDTGAYGILVRLTHKAAARLRKINYCAGGVSIGVSYRDSSSPATRETGEPARCWNGYGQGGWNVGCRVPHCQDTPTILHAVAKLWKGRPRGQVPFKIGVVLSDLKPARSATPSLFEEDRKAAEVSRAMDLVNAEFGASMIHFGTMHGLEDQAPTRIAFTQIPDFDRRVS
jgi:DNA polymerase-4